MTHLFFLFLTIVATGTTGLFEYHEPRSFPFSLWISISLLLVLWTGYVRSLLVTRFNPTYVNAKVDHVISCCRSILPA